MKLKKYFTILFCIALTSSAAGAAVLLDRVVAVVNQDVITWSELYRSMELDASPQLKEMKEEERRKVFKESESLFLENLINTRLQLQEAKNSGISVAEEEVKEAIDGIMKKYSMNDSVFTESLKKEGFTLEEYKKRLREQILMSKVVSQQIRNKILVTEEDIKKFIAENKDSSDPAEGYRISQIFFKMPKNAEEKSSVEKRAEDVLNRLKAGESFSDLAKKYSEESSGSNGGDLGVLKKSHLLKEFSETVSKMKPGDVSAPFWTERGLHIIKVNEKLEAKSINEIREEAKKAVTDKMFEAKYAGWIKSLREKAFIEIRL